MIALRRRIARIRLATADSFAGRLGEPALLVNRRNSDVEHVCGRTARRTQHYRGADIVADIVPVPTRCYRRSADAPVGPVVQWSELAAHNRLVAGSSPAGPTTGIKDLI